MLYTVGEMAKKFDIVPSTLRYYDKEGLLPFVERSGGGIRMFKESDSEWLSVIECLKKTGMTIREIRQFIDWCIEGDSTIFAGLFARLRSSLEDKIRFGQVQTTDARNIHRRHLQTLPCKEEEKEENRKLSLTCRSPFTIFVEYRIRL